MHVGPRPADLSGAEPAGRCARSRYGWGRELSDQCASSGSAAASNQPVRRPSRLLLTPHRGVAAFSQFARPPRRSLAPRLRRAGIRSASRWCPANASGIEAADPLDLAPGGSSGCPERKPRAADLSDHARFALRCRAQRGRPDAVPSPRGDAAAQGQPGALPGGGSPGGAQGAGLSHTRLRIAGTRAF
jgi:hypothetical protein